MKEPTRKRIVLALLIVVLMLMTMLLILSMSSRQFRNDHCGSHCKYGFIVVVYTGYFSLNETGLDADSMKNITNETFMVVLSSANTSAGRLTFHLIVENGSFQSLTQLRYNLYQDAGHLDHVETVFLKLEINSTDPDIRSLVLWGKDNTETIKVFRVRSGFDVETSKELEDKISEDERNIHIAIPPLIYLKFGVGDQCVVC